MTYAPAQWQGLPVKEHLELLTKYVYRQDKRMDWFEKAITPPEKPLTVIMQKTNDFLTEQLKHGAVPIKRLEALAAKEGIKLFQLRKARERMQIESYRPNGPYTPYYWRFPREKS